MSRGKKKRAKAGSLNDGADESTVFDFLNAMPVNTQGSSGETRTTAATFGNSAGLMKPRAVCKAVHKVF